jgi:hypothetical protein
MTSDGNFEWQPVERSQPFTGKEDSNPISGMERRPRIPPRVFDPLKNEGDKKTLDDLRDSCESLVSKIKDTDSRFHLNNTWALVPDVPYTKILLHSNDLHMMETVVSEGLNTVSKDKDKTPNKIKFSCVPSHYNISVPYIVDPALTEKVRELGRSGKKVKGVRTVYRVNLNSDSISKDVFLPEELQSDPSSGPLQMKPTIEDIEYIGGTISQLSQRLQPNAKM